MFCLCPINTDNYMAFWYNLFLPLIIFMIKLPTCTISVFVWKLDTKNVNKSVFSFKRYFLAIFWFIQFQSYFNELIVWLYLFKAAIGKNYSYTFNSTLIWIAIKNVYLGNMYFLFIRQRGEFSILRPLETLWILIIVF